MNINTSLTKDNTVIFSCTSLAVFLKEAQRRQGTQLPVVWLDRKWHMDPKIMKGHIEEELAKLPVSIENVLVSMGFCGGSWEGICTSHRLVFAAVDDCVSLLLTTDEERLFDRKDWSHLYVKDKHPAFAEFRTIYENYTADKSEETKQEIYDRWKAKFRGVELIETDVFDPSIEGGWASAKADADWLGVEFIQTPGSIQLLEKLVSGRWTGQFCVFEPGEPVRKDAFL